MPGVTCGGTASGTLVDLYTCNGTGAQVWQPQAGRAMLNPQSGRCLTTPAPPPRPGPRSRSRPCSGGANQSWSQP